MRQFTLRFTGDRKRLRLDFNKQMQEAFGLTYGDQLIATGNDEGDIVLRRVDGEKFGDPARSEKIAALRAAQRAQGLREVASWNMLVQSHLRLSSGTRESGTFVPQEFAQEFSWWLRQKMARERKLVQKRIAAEVLGVGGAREVQRLGGRRGREWRVNASGE